MHYILKAQGTTAKSLEPRIVIELTVGKELYEFSEDQNTQY